MKLAHDEEELQTEIERSEAVDESLWLGGMLTVRLGTAVIHQNLLDIADKHGYEVSTIDMNGRKITFKRQ